VFVPLGEVSHAEKILIVEQKLLKAGACNVHELDLGLGRSDGGLATFRDVLLSRACCLNHLVARAVAGLEKVFAEAKSKIVNHLGLPVGMEGTVVSGLLKELLR